MVHTISLKDKVSKFIENNSLLKSGDKVLVALSGGADSVFLIKMLCDLGYECEAAHCNFHLRGKESQRDEDFVRALCQSLNVRLHTKDFNTAIYATDKGISIEMTARELRYAFFEQLAEEYGAQAIAVGHHRDDNVETLLLNIVRGTGIRGVRGIQPRNGKIIRPLLCLSHEDITSHLERNGMEYVTDSSNKLDVYSRNKIRLNVMPILSTVNFAASENIAMTIDNLSEACKIYENAVKESISKCLTVVGNTQVVDINTLLCEVSPRSILHEILSPLGFTNAQVFDILRAAEGGEPGRMFGAKQWRLLIDRGQIIIAPQPDESADIEYKFRFASHSGCMRFDGFGLIRYNIVDNVNLEFKTDKNFAYFDVDKMHGPLTIRTVQQGDSFTPFGLKGTKLLSDFMTDIKLNRFEKENQKVMCDANQIAWVIGKRSSDIFRVDEATKKVLILEFVRA